MPHRGYSYLMLVLSIVDYAPSGDTSLLNIALVFGSSPAAEPATWTPTTAWESLADVGGDPEVVRATLDKLVEEIKDAPDHFNALDEIAGYYDDIDIEAPVPLLYSDEEQGLDLIQGALEARSSVPLS